MIGSSICRVTEIYARFTIRTDSTRTKKKKSEQGGASPPAYYFRGTLIGETAKAATTAVDTTLLLMG